MKKYLFSALVGVSAIFGVTSASAAITFEFNTVIAGAPQGGPVFATLLIEDSGVDTVSLTLSHTADPGQAGGQSIKTLLLNVDPFVSGTVTSGSSKFKSYSFSENGKNDSGAMFDLRIDFDTAMNNRFLAGDSVAMTATGTGLTEDSFNAFSAGVPYLGMIHFISVPPDQNSAKVVAVPEPASLFALGLGAVVLLRRRKK
ncbi:MAG: PEP-CTERM sorting domain-containing protein [Armatimonadetes bacterium]|nr:PEP-CTERM sorting domain-containing protein [Armatimonadota bacterium]